MNTTEMTEFEVWKTIKLGVTGRLLSGESCNIVEWCEKYGTGHVSGVSHTAVSMARDPEFRVNDPIDLDLVLVDPKEIGCTSSNFTDLCEEIKIKTGLLECPAEVGPQLQSQWNPEEAVYLVRKDREIHVGMKTIDIYKNARIGPMLYHFCIFIDFIPEPDGRHIYAPNLKGEPEDRTQGYFIFVKPRK